MVHSTANGSARLQRWAADLVQAGFRAVTRSVARLLVMAAVAACAVVGIVAPMAIAADTPTLGSGDCWQPGTPALCRDTWTGTNTFVYFRAIDNFSSSAPSWATPAQSAVTSWDLAIGPQYYSYTPTTNDTWVYLNYSSTGQHDLTDSTVLGTTWNCTSAAYCTDGWAAIHISWSDVYLNHNALSSSADVQQTVAHESGHAMGLWHNPSSSSLMYPTTGGASTPQTMDIGGYPGCYLGSLGLRCIYGQGD